MLSCHTSGQTTWAASHGRGRGSGCHRGRCNAISISREHSSWLSCYYWQLNDPFCFIHCNTDSQCFSVGQTTPKIAHSFGGFLTPSNTWFLGPIRVNPQTASWSVQPFLQGISMWSKHRQTERQTMLRAVSVAIGHIYAMHTITIQPKNINSDCILFTLTSQLAGV